MNIWVNGCFDILHSGHIDLLWFAKLYSNNNDIFLPNKLYVGVDGDERVKQLKGDNRPINNIETRVKILSNLKMVDDVVIFHDDEELRYFIKKFNIDFIIIGDHYINKTVIGRECVNRGVVYYKTDQRSTTGLIKKIKEL